jgi:hypothetical protein
MRLIEYKLYKALAPMPSKLVVILVFSPGKSSAVDPGPFPTAPAIATAKQPSDNDHTTIRKPSDYKT